MGFSSPWSTPRKDREASPPDFLSHTSLAAALEPENPNNRALFAFTNVARPSSGYSRRSGKDPMSFVETGKPRKTLSVVSLRWSSTKCAALGPAYMLYMDQNVGSCVPKYLSRRASYGESVCWITPSDNRMVVKHWLRLGYGDAEWLWRHEALAFGARCLGEHLQSAQSTGGLTQT